MICKALLFAPVVAIVLWAALLLSNPAGLALVAAAVVLHVGGVLWVRRHP